MNECQYCNRIITNAGSLKSHQKRCNFNPNRQQWDTARANKPAWNSGKSLQQLLGKQRSDSYKERISTSNKGKGGCASTQEKQLLRRQSISKTMKGNPNFGGYRIGSGRGKGCWYESPIAGRVYCDSTYQLFYSRWLDSQNVVWKRNKIKFPYIYNEKQHYYIPDFYIVNQDYYIETKGYKTDKDDAKWNQFPYKLKVLYQNDLKMLGMSTRKIVSNGG